MHRNLANNNKDDRILQDKPKFDVFLKFNQCFSFFTNFNLFNWLSKFQLNFNFGRVRVHFSSLSRSYFSSSSWSYPALAKFGLPNGLDQSFAAKLPSATGSEICARKTRMDFRFAHLCKITLISKGTNTLITSLSPSSSFTQPNNSNILLLSSILQFLSTQI